MKIMKQFMLFAFAAMALGLSACKKDRQCKCTVTTTYPNGNVNTDIDQRTTYLEIRKSAAKSRCQNYENVYVSENGGTTTTKGECKLN
jgi:hypothetical protein